MTFAEEVRDRIVAQGVIATSKIGTSSSYNIPTTGDVVMLRETGGTSPFRTHNTGATPSYRRPSMQIMCHSATSSGARALAEKVFLAVTIRDMFLSGTWYLFIEPIQEPFDMGIDDNKRAKVGFNIRALKRPSVA